MDARSGTAESKPSSPGYESISSPAEYRERTAYGDSPNIDELPCVLLYGNSRLVCRRNASWSLS